MTNDNFCFYLQNRLIQTSQTGGQQYSDTSPFSIPWLGGLSPATTGDSGKGKMGEKSFYCISSRNS